MQQSGEINSCRPNRLSSEKQYQSFNLISKSLTVSQSTGKVLQRYFYRRQSANQAKIQLLKLKKLNSEKVTSFHNRSVKNTMSKGNDDETRQQMNTELPLLNFQRIIAFEEPKRIIITPKYQKVNKKSSQWTVTQKKINNYSKKKTHAQSSDFKLKVESKILKQKYQSGSTHVDILLRRHKAGNIRQIQQRLRSTVSRAGTNQSQRYVSLKDYNRKCGFSESQKIFIWNSEDQYIKRILNNWGWLQNQSLQSPFFHIKWTYMPLFIDAKISDKQFTNHFKNSQQITSKSSLSKNLKQNQSSFGKIDYYYPKCFDVGNNTQLLLFVQQYRHNVMLILLKKIHKYLKSKIPKQIQKFDLLYEYYYRHDPYHSEMNYKHHKKSILRNKGFKSIEMEDYKNLNKDCILHIHLVIETLRYWRNFRKQKQEYFDNGHHFLQFNSENFHNNFYDLKKYSQFDDIGQPNNQITFSKQFFSTPSSILVQRISKQYQFCKNTGHLFPTFGCNNIWIVKPASNSRGNGIYLTTDLYEIQSSGRGIQSRLVQKYIQKPLLIKNPQWKQLYMRKFDIRQWVLLKSIQPFSVYMFSECYLRLCYEKYDEKQIQQLNKHLTNYSINKLKFKNKQQSVLPLSYLKKVMLKQYNINWQLQIKPKIKQIILKSTKSCLENLEDHGGSCFQLLGFDILIDQQFTPWLIQINMSPACQERTSWLTEYLNDMGTGLLKLVLPTQLLPQDIQQCNFKYKWQVVQKQQAFLNRKKDIQINLQIIGQQIGLNQQKNVDILLIHNKMAKKIQKFFKQYIPKYKLFKQKRKQKFLTIQNYFASLLNTKKYKKKCEIYYGNKITSYLSILPSFICFQKSVKRQNIDKLCQYFRSIQQVSSYFNDLIKYKRAIMINLAQIVKKKKQTQVFCRQLTQKVGKIRYIQQKCRQYLQFRQSKRKQLQKYFKIVLEVNNFQKKKRSIQIHNNYQIIYNYFKPLEINRRTQEKIIQNKQKTICTYLGSLLKRRQFYTKKLDIFIYIVGRVERVTKRRTRCNHFKVILASWKADIQKQDQKSVQIQNNKLKLLLTITRQKQAKNSQNSQKILKVGYLRPNKKIDQKKQ